MSRLLYLAEPIDQVQAPGGWKESVYHTAITATRLGWIVYRPARAFMVGADAEPGPDLEEVNRLVLQRAGGLLAFAPKGVPTIGVPREIEYALSLDIPVLVATDLEAWSLTDLDTAGLYDEPAIERWLARAPVTRTIGRALLFTVDDNGQLPARTYDGDAGYDLFVSESVVIPPGEFVDVASGLRVCLPPGVWGRITGRSSTLRRRNLLVAEGVLDTGYRGPLYSGVYNLGAESAEVYQGERIAQLVLHHNVAAGFVPTQVDARAFERLPGDGRGAAGFGSTGT